MPFRVAELQLPIESTRVVVMLDQAASLAAGRHPLLAIAAVRALPDVTHSPGQNEGEEGSNERDSIAQALLGWAAGCRTLEELRERIEITRASLARLRTDDAALLLATAHGTKGLEFDHVAVIGLDEGRFPSARSVAEALEPERALEEERRLAYVAWTRPRRSLTLVYDPGSPSPFLLEAFSPEELTVSRRHAA
jgi:superfamily I DNA/RNA helicase